jgi:hypothetical protein
MQSIICSDIFHVVGGKKFGKRMLHTKYTTFFGDYVGVAFLRGVDY